MSVKFSDLKMCQCKKRDKYEVCPDCTLSTKYLVFDGKFVGPNKHAIDHLDEEDHEDDDGMEVLLMESLLVFQFMVLN